MKRLRLLLAMAIVGCGCAPQAEYIYTPRGATSWADGRPITITGIPQEAPQGDVQLSSFGIAQLTSDGGRAVEALHVRMTITNTTDPSAWIVDTTGILLDLGQEGRSRAMFVNTDVSTLPLVTIARGDRKVIDLYFPVPSNVDEESRLPAFDVVWQVATASRAIASRTSFRAVEVTAPNAPPSAEVALVSGWGPLWWYNPLWYPGPVFVHRGPITIRHAPAHVVVTRHPRWHYHPKQRPRPLVRDHRR